MENKSKSISLKLILIAIAIGIWVIVLQNTGIIPTNQNVYVVNTVDSHVSGGNIEVTGSINVDNKVSVSIDEVLGEDGKKYYFNNR